MDKNILIKKIALEGKKISDLELTEYISGEELIEITQDQKSKAVSIDTILESANTGVIKIPRRDITLDKAISLVKDSQKSFGAILHFHNGETDSWEMYRYNNPSIKDFDDTSNWEYINISNNFKGLFPTEKDLLARFPRPSLNDYALVGTTMESADTYYATTPSTWSKTANKLSKKLCKYKGITSRDANIKVVCTPTPASKSCSRPYRRGNSVYWRLEDGTEEWLFDVTDDINLICPETPDEEMYDVSVRTTEGGTFTPQPVITPVPFNTTINLTAIPEEGYEFKYWQVGDTKHTTPELTVKVTDDVVVLGVFEKKEVPLPPTPPTPQPKPKYTIKSRAVNGGITVPSSITVEEGTEVEIVAIVPENKLFKHWTLNNQVVGTDSTIKVIADGNKEYVAIIEDKPTPKPTPIPVITYDIEADTTPVSITIDDTTQEREVCFSYKVVKNTTLEGNTTKEYVSNYTSNRAKDRFCVTTSTNQQLPLEVNVDGTVLNKTFTINVTDNRTPDRGFFEVDYPNSTGIEETPEGPRLINQCYTDGTGGVVTYTIKLTERSNPFVGIPENLPQGIEVTLSEDKKTMTIKTICNVISNVVGKIFDVFDFFKRMISVFLSPAQEVPQPVPTKYTVQVSHAGDIDHPYAENLSVDARTMFTPRPAFTDTHEVEFFQVDGRQENYSPDFGYMIEGDMSFSIIYRRKQNATPPQPDLGYKLTVNYIMAEEMWPMHTIRETIFGGGNYTIQPYSDPRYDLSRGVKSIKRYNRYTDYQWDELGTSLPLEVNVQSDDMVIDVIYQPNGYYALYNLTYHYIDYDNSTPINAPSLPTEELINGVSDLEYGPIYHSITPPEIPGYKFVEFIVEGGTPITMLPYSTNIWSDTNITFKYVKLATDSYGKPLPFKFSPHIIDYIRFSHPELSSTGNFGSGDYVASMIQKNDFALKVGNKPLDKSWFPITITDGVTTRTYIATDEREYKSNASDVWEKYSTLNIDYQPTANIIVRDGNEDVFYVAHYKNFMLKDNNNHPIGGKFINSLTPPGAIEYIYGRDYSHFDRDKLYNRSKSKELLPYDKKEITVTIKGEEYKFKPDTIDTVRIVAYAAPRGEYNLMLFPWTIEGHGGIGYVDGITDATVVPIMSSPTAIIPTPPRDDEETTTPQPPAEDDTTDYSIYVGKPEIVLNESNNGDYGPFNYTISYNSVESNIHSITWDIPSLGINSGEITNDSGFSFSFSVDNRIQEDTIEVRQDVIFDNAKNFSETYILTPNGMFRDV